TIRVSWKQEIRAELRQIFNGGEFKPILDEAQAIHKRVLRGRVFVALHMHAGDGNVHTNIPVNSDNYELLPGADLRNAYTPSFGLMGYESLIMQQSDIGAIADSVKDCLRCGKCKPVCATHVPRANLLYSPRNKILATSLLIE